MLMRRMPRCIYVICLVGGAFSQAPQLRRHQVHGISLRALLEQQDSQRL